MIHALIAILHALAAAGWFGAMVYSLLVLQPRARQFFQSDEAFEEFLATISRGARWKVLSALGLIGLSGLLLIPLTRPEPLDATWQILILLKSVLFLAAMATFWYISWRLWPMRIFATSQELPTIHRRFRIAGYGLIGIAAASIAMGIIAHVVR